MKGLPGPITYTVVCPIAKLFLTSQIAKFSLTSQIAWLARLVTLLSLLGGRFFISFVFWGVVGVVFQDL